MGKQRTKFISCLISLREQLFNNSEINISLMKTSRGELEVFLRVSNLKINREAKFCRLFTLLYERERSLL